MTLEVQETDETGKNWPHGERETLRNAVQLDAFRFREPVKPEVRERLMALRDEAYRDGVVQGRQDVEREHIPSEAIMYVLGLLSGAGAYAGFLHLFG